MEEENRSGPRYLGSQSGPASELASWGHISSLTAYQQVLMGPYSTCPKMSKVLEELSSH